MTVKKLTRREFQAAVGTSIAACAVPSHSQETSPRSQETSPNWIDAHVHVWTPDTAKYPLDADYQVSSMRPPSFTPEQLFAHAHPAGVNRIVLIQMSFYNFDNRYMTDMMQAHPGVFSGVGIVDHQSSDVASKMKNLAAKGVRGFRLHSRGGSAASWPNDPGMQLVWKTAADENLTVCPLITPDDLPHIDSLCKQFPKTKVVVDHFGRVGIRGEITEKELSALCRLADHPLTHVKTSAFYALGQKSPPYHDLIPMIRRVVDAFGADRLMWASDCPYQVQGNHTYAASLELIRDQCDFLTSAQKTAMLRGTAERIFFG